MPFTIPLNVDALLANLAARLQSVARPTDMMILERQIDEAEAFLSPSNDPRLSITFDLRLRLSKRQSAGVAEGSMGHPAVMTQLNTPTLHKKVSSTASTAVPVTKIEGFSDSEADDSDFPSLSDDEIVVTGERLAMHKRLIHRKFILTKDELKAIRAWKNRTRSVRYRWDQVVLSIPSLVAKKMSGKDCHRAFYAQRLRAQLNNRSWPY